MGRGAGIQTGRDPLNNTGHSGQIHPTPYFYCKTLMPMRVVRILIVAATSVLVAVPAVAAVPFPSLEAAQSAAMRVAPAARLAKAGLLQGQAGRAAAGLSRWHNPQLEIRGDRGNKKVTEDVYLQVNLMWPLEVSGQSQARQTESDNLHQQLRTEQVAAQASARGEVSAAWGAVVVGG
jgi:hypothetical protein